MTNRKPSKYNGAVGGNDVETKKGPKKHETTSLFEWKHQLMLAFGPLFTCKNLINFNPSRRVNPSLDIPGKGRGGGGGGGADLLVLIFL